MVELASVYDLTAPALVIHFVPIISDSLRNQKQIQSSFLFFAFFQEIYFLLPLKVAKQRSSVLRPGNTPSRIFFLGLRTG